jgi:hypothetical protein
MQFRWYLSLNIIQFKVLEAFFCWNRHLEDTDIQFTVVKSCARVSIWNNGLIRAATCYVHVNTTVYTTAWIHISMKIIRHMCVNHILICLLLFLSVFRTTFSRMCVYVELISLLMSIVLGNVANIQGSDKVMYCTHLFVNMGLDQLLPSVQPQFFLERTGTSSEQSLTEFYTILLEKHLQVALEMFEVGICSSL